MERECGSGTVSFFWVMKGVIYRKKCRFGMHEIVYAVEVKDSSGAVQQKYSVVLKYHFVMSPFLSLYD